MSREDRHDYWNLMRENGGDMPPAPNGNIGDMLKLLLGALVVLQIIVWIVT